MDTDENVQGQTSTAEDVQAIVESLRSLDPDWKPNELIEPLPGIKWRPDLVHANKRSLLHVHLSERLRPYALRRLEAAAADGYSVRVALPIGALYDEELLVSLSGIGPDVHLSDRQLESVADDLLLTLALESIVVDHETRRALAQPAWERAQVEPRSYIKGRRLEALLGFLLSQVEDFRIVEHNLRTDTEELDLVIQQRLVSGERCWSALGAPFIIVEAKNWSSKVDQPQVSNLRIKMLGRRGNCRLAFIVGASGFTGDAFEQELRFASNQETIAFFEGDDIQAWIDSEEPTDWLEKHVRKAMLR